MSELNWKVPRKWLPTINQTSVTVIWKYFRSSSSILCFNWTWIFIFHWIAQQSTHAQGDFMNFPLNEVARRMRIKIYEKHMHHFVVHLRFMRRTFLPHFKAIKTPCCIFSPSFSSTICFMLFLHYFVAHVLWNVKGKMLRSAVNSHADYATWLGVAHGKVENCWYARRWRLLAAWLQSYQRCLQLHMQILMSCLS